MRKDAPGHAPGFSLVEATAVLAVVSILLGLALPGLQDVVRRQRGATALHLISTQLAQARTTAIARRTPVTVCPSLGDGRCRAEPDWSAGWLVYRDVRRRDQPQSSGDILYEARRPLHGSVQARASVGRVRVRYQPDGRSGGNNLTIRVCVGASAGGEVIVNNVGRVRSKRSPAGTPCPPP
ncbi:MAG: GspH/FimT family pseudopilin [Proteobacteria bacterium]|nr:GspH/FimT family pseudopilin [Pseudomonadota bacterium]